MKISNPIIWADLPDLDVIRVRDTYYMVSTTMHMMPGCVILRSYDLANWEILTYVYETLDSTPGQRLQDGKGIYGKGMWAASLRYHSGVFYICFVSNDTGKTYIYKARDIMGPWEKHEVQGFYHDCSLLFERSRAYIVYGNREIHLTELNESLTGPLKGGIDRVILRDTEDYMLGFEGAHFYKINGKYYVFLIHWPKNGTHRRVEACYWSDSLEGEFQGGNILDDDLEYHNSGVAQGGIVDTPQGDWYAMLFQDHGAVGRIPVLVPIHWEKEVPVFGVNGRVPKTLTIASNRKGHVYMPLVESDDFHYSPTEDGKVSLKKVWQWNHEPDPQAWSVTARPGYLRLRTTDLRGNVVQAANTLTQRTFGPKSQAMIILDGSGMRNGDYAGISAFQSQYGFLALTREMGQYYVVMLGRSKPKNPQAFNMGQTDTEPGIEYERVPVSGNQVTLKVVCDFTNGVDEAQFYYEKEGTWVKVGITLHMQFTLDHFMGYRFALSYYSTEEAGGCADFERFVIDRPESQ